jgi:hypothetical protein
MGILAVDADERVDSVAFSNDALVVGLKDGRQISVPLAWFPRLAEAPEALLNNWELCGGGYGIHWPDLDEDLSTEGLLRGAPAPKGSFSN